MQLRYLRVKLSPQKVGTHPHQALTGAGKPTNINLFNADVLWGNEGAPKLE